VKFSQTDDPSAIYVLAYTTVTYDMGMHAKFRSRNRDYGTDRKQD